MQLVKYRCHLSTSRRWQAHPSISRSGIIVIEYGKPLEWGEGRGEGEQEQTGDDSAYGVPHAIFLEDPRFDYVLGRTTASHVSTPALPESRRASLGGGGRLQCPGARLFGASARLSGSFCSRFQRVRATVFFVPFSCSILSGWRPKQVIRDGLDWWGFGLAPLESI